ncbi:unnamed protein product, partial [Allacma fusca]
MESFVNCIIKPRNALISTRCIRGSSNSRYVLTRPFTIAANPRPLLLSHTIFEPTKSEQVPPLLITHGL